MGFKLPKRTAKVAFEEGHEYHGLEMELDLGVPLAYAMEIMSLVGSTDSDALADLARRFGDVVLLGWNLEDEDGNQIPATGEGITSLPISTIVMLFGKWMEAQQMSAPLDEASSDTGGSVTPLQRTGSE